MQKSQLELEAHAPNNLRPCLLSCFTLLFSCSSSKPSFTRCHAQIPSCDLLFSHVSSFLTLAVSLKQLLHSPVCTAFLQLLHNLPLKISLLYYLCQVTSVILETFAPPPLLHQRLFILLSTPPTACHEKPFHATFSVCKEPNNEGCYSVMGGKGQRCTSSNSNLC